MAVANEENMLDNNFDERSSIIGLGYKCRVLRSLHTYLRIYVRMHARLH